MIRVFSIIAFFCLGSAAFAQNYSDKERLGFYNQCIANNESRCCDHLTATLAETLCVCASSCNRPVRMTAYEQCVGNPAGDRDVSQSCCEHLIDGDAQLLQVCAHRQNRVNWAEVQAILEAAAKAYASSNSEQ